MYLESGGMPSMNCARMQTHAGGKKPAWKNVLLHLWNPLNIISRMCFFYFFRNISQRPAPLWLWQKPLWTFHQPLNTLHNHFLTSTSLNKSWLLIRQTCKRLYTHIPRFVSWLPSSSQQGLFHVSNCACLQPSTPPHNPTHSYKIENTTAVPPTEIGKLWWSELNQLLLWCQRA